MIRYILVRAAKKDIPRLIKYKKDIIHMYNKDLSEDEKNKINEYVTNSVSEMFKDYYNIVFDDKIIGSILLKDIQEGKLIDEIYIEKEFRNNGIGTDIIMKAVKKSNNKNIYLWVYKENIKAVSLYKRLGFKIIDETESRYYMEYNVKRQKQNENNKKEEQKIKIDILKQISKHNPIPGKLSYDSFSGIGIEKKEKIE